MTANTSPDKPNIRQVASIAGVSHMTVSRVLNGYPNIKDATRRRVLEVIEELDYRPNLAARALATQRTKRIGVMVESAVEYGPSSTLRAVEFAARESGYSVTSVALRDDDEMSPAGRGRSPHGAGRRCHLRHRAALVVGRRTAEDHDRGSGARHQGGQRSQLPHGLGRPAVRNDARRRPPGCARAPRHPPCGRATRLARCAGPGTRLPCAGKSWGMRERPIVVGDWTADFAYDFADSITAPARVHRDLRGERRDGVGDRARPHGPGLPRTRRPQHRRASTTSRSAVISSRR